MSAPYWISYAIVAGLSFFEVIEQSTGLVLIALIIVYATLRSIDRSFDEHRDRLNRETSAVHERIDKIQERIDVIEEGPFR
jgi:uncharacterized membrane protein